MLNRVVLGLGILWVRPEVELICRIRVEPGEGVGVRSVAGGGVGVRVVLGYGLLAGPARRRSLLAGHECGLAEIGNSKEETRGTQFRQVRAARCVIPYILYDA
jgi:hypothetical protein